MEYRGYNIVGDGMYGNRLIKTIGPGALPFSLSGFFTKIHMAEMAINHYVDGKAAAKKSKPKKKE